MRTVAKLVILWLIGVTSGLVGLGRATAAPGGAYLDPAPTPGERFSNVFSVASSVRVDGFDELVRRNGGTADYVFEGPASDGLRFLGSFRYDGGDAGNGQATVLRDRGSNVCGKTRCQPYTDASGLLYNARIWGLPPQDLREGLSWNVAISSAWELGAAGTQNVRVLRLDPKSGCVVLTREGRAAGAFTDEKLSVDLVRGGKSVTFQVKPGLAHWKGLTTFCHGMVFSDELLVDRIDQFEAAGTGPVSAVRRRYMLLNSAPYPTL